MSEYKTQNPHEAWENQNYLSLKRSARMGWLAAFAGLTCAGLMALALAAALPLKTIEPIVMTVDAGTGLVNVQSKLGNITLDDEDALTQSLLFRYVRDRETYDNIDLEDRINSVYEISRSKARNDLALLYSEENPNNPREIYGATGRITVKIQSVILQPGNRALIRLQKSTQRQSGEAPFTRNFVATIGFEFDREGTMTLAERWENPVGFFVNDYRIDEEAN